MDLQPLSPGEVNWLAEVKSWSKSRSVRLLRDHGSVVAGNWMSKERLVRELLLLRRRVIGTPLTTPAAQEVAAGRPQEARHEAEAAGRGNGRAEAPQRRQDDARAAVKDGGPSPPYNPTMGVCRVGDCSWIAHPGAVGDGLD